jgi:hypothetical protein
MSHNLCAALLGYGDGQGFAAGLSLQLGERRLRSLDLQALLLSCGALDGIVDGKQRLPRLDRLPPGRSVAHPAGQSAPAEPEPKTC